MPYSNVPEEKWGDMDSCVEKVMADGKTKEQAIAICYSSIVERQNLEEEALPQEEPIEEKETEENISFLPSEDEEPVGLAAELGTEEAPPVDDLAVDPKAEEAPIDEQEIAGEPEQEITEGVEGPPADETSGIVKVEFIDDGDDFEMDAAIAGIGGESPYPDMSGQEPPPYKPPESKPPEDGEMPITDKETTPAGGAWTPPDISIQELMDMEPASMFYNHTVPEVRAQERELRSLRNRANRLQRIADLRPKEEANAVERVVGVFRRIGKFVTGKSYPAPHCGRPGEKGGSAPRDECAAAGAEGEADVGVAARPEHVGASIKIKELANPRTTTHVNDVEGWDEIESSGWGTNPDTGEMVDSGAWQIASSVVNSAQRAIRGGEEAGGESSESIVQRYVDDMISSDIENDHHEVERTLKDEYKLLEQETLGANPTWLDIAEFIKKSQDEMLHMSDSDIDDAIGATLGVEFINRMEADTEEEIFESWQKEYLLGDDSYDELRERASELEGGLVEWLSQKAYNSISDHHSGNPSGYDADYFIDEVGIEPEDLGMRGEDDYDDGDGSGEFSGISKYYYARDNETGEIVSVMQTSPTDINLSQSQLEEVAQRFGIDATDISSEMLSIDLLASKYPRQGYGTEMILNALQQAHEEDRGVAGSAVMAAAMFYNKLGAQYLGEMGQEEGGGAFWTNAQVHTAYEWLQSQLSAVEAGELSEAEISAEQAGAEARAPSTPDRGEVPVQGESTGEPYGQMAGRRLPSTLGEMAGTRWTNPGAGGGDVVINYDNIRGEWSANDMNDEGNELFTYDAEDAGYFFDRLANENLTVPELATTLSPQHIASAIRDGVLSIDVNRPRQETESARRVASPTTPQPSTLAEPVEFAGVPQGTSLILQNPVANDSGFLSFSNPDGGRPLLALMVDAPDGERVWEVVGSGQLYRNSSDLMGATAASNFIADAEGYVGSDTFTEVAGEIEGEQAAARFSYRMLRLNQEAARRVPVEASMAARSAMRRIERHYGPGPHPGTGTPQEVHGKGGGGATSVGVTSARPGKASGQVFEEMRSFADELNQIPTIKNVSVTAGLGGWQGGRESTWVVSYEGNGNAMRLIARTAMKHEQEGVLFTREGGEEPVSTFAFSDAIQPNERDAVENLLGETGVGGWQWFRLPGGQPTLRIVNVPQYGGDAETHRQSMKKLTQMFDALEMPHEFNEAVKKVDILEKEGPYGYNTILEG